MDDLNNFYVIGVNYKNLDINERELFIKNNPKHIIEDFYHKGFISGFVYLLTCLRVEFYIEINNNFDIEDLIKNLGFNEQVYTKVGIDGLRYLFEVICGFDSILVGEDQILSQIKKSYFANLEEKKTSGVLNKIFNNAIAVGKKFRSQSSILEKGLSLEGIAVKFIENHFDDIKDKHVFVIGLGDLAQSIIYILIKEGVKNITVTNRSLHKNLTIKQKFDVATASFSEKYDFINFSDIIISATSAPHCIIKKDELEKYLTIDKKRFFLDLAVPRDIEDHIIQIEGVNLYNIDHLWETQKNNLSERNNISLKYKHLIDEQIEEFREWFVKRNKLVLVNK